MVFSAALLVYGEPVKAEQAECAGLAWSGDAACSGGIGVRTEAEVGGVLGVSPERQWFCREAPAKGAGTPHPV